MDEDLRYIFRQRRDLIGFECRPRGKGHVLCLECMAQRGGEFRADGLRIRHADAAQVLGLEAEIAAPHADSIAADEELAHG